ncbi:hypothetical protein [uncultured Tateyamaria sp.]|uniref:hypothetical protein n=1 Tax=uncultured Tateyamaria sp. TaxID=455651 RepID=UPI0026317F54|nr:hypothetical protein [uncultured Tateyamaria sp.]
MPFDLAWVDLFRLYILRGEATTWHAVLSVIYVESYETATVPGEPSFAAWRGFPVMSISLALIPPQARSLPALQTRKGTLETNLIGLNHGSTSRTLGLSFS